MFRLNSITMMMLSRLTPLLPCLLLLAGCGAKETSVVPVSGTVTFAGGPCPKPGTITFSPQSVAEGHPRRPGTASFNEDGAYVASSFGQGDGLVPGVYTASISCWNGNPSGDDPSSFERLNLAPTDYRPEVVVKVEAGEVIANFDVPPKKK
jgi:hypothetical protein